MSEKPKFTPGPWAQQRRWPLEIVQASDINKKRGCASDPARDAREHAQSIASVQCDENDYDHSRWPHRFTSLRKDECLANAHLIAAAPELYEALLLLDEAGCIPEMGSLPKADLKIGRAAVAARAALAKARGEGR